MSRMAAISLLICLYGGVAFAQDLDSVQIHGFVTQGFLFSTHNNYLTMKSSSGSPQWTEGDVSLTDSISEKLRVGIQLHMYQMGEIGGPNVLIDWVSGDYQIDEHIGVRAGKVKIPVGLFNDSQDVDSLFLWTLLPQANYPDDDRDFDLAVLGGEVYGWLRAGRYGRLQYRGYAGENRLDANGGSMRDLAEVGLTFDDPPSGKCFGGDLRWETPWRGLTIGTSVESQTLDGTGPEGSFHMAPMFLTAYHAEWNWGKWNLAGEYWRIPYTVVLQSGAGSIGQSIDERNWHPMVSYQLTKKLQIGTYYSHSVDQAADSSQPESYAKDWALSGRYNFSTNFYGKMEVHFLHGTEIGYHMETNPDGLKPNTMLLAARIGFTF